MKEITDNKNRLWTASRECAYLAVFVALTIAAQLCLAAVPGVEIVTVLFVSFAFSFGMRRGALAATSFSLIRQLVFGFYPTVLILYLVYYNVLAVVFGGLGKKIKKPASSLWLVVLVACLCTICFSLLDNVITILWYSYAPKAARAYVLASFTVLVPQVVCTLVTVLLLFLPLQKAFYFVKR